MSAAQQGEHAVAPVSAKPLCWPIQAFSCHLPPPRQDRGDAAPVASPALVAIQVRRAEQTRRPRAHRLLLPLRQQRRPDGCPAAGAEPLDALRIAADARCLEGSGVEWGRAESYSPQSEATTPPQAWPYRLNPEQVYAR